MKLFTYADAIPTVEEGYNICLIFFLRIWPLIEPKLGPLDSEVFRSHSLFCEVVCFEAESYMEWHDAVFRGAGVRSIDEMTPERYESDFDPSSARKLSLNAIFLSVIEFCRIYHEKYQEHGSGLPYLLELLQSMTKGFDEHPEEWKIWKRAVSDVVKKRKYICSTFFWNFQWALGRFEAPSPEVDQLMKELFSVPKNRVGRAGDSRYQKDVYLLLLPDGNQLWGYVDSGTQYPQRNGEILDFGINRSSDRDWLRVWSKEDEHENGGLLALTTADFVQQTVTSPD